MKIVTVLLMSFFLCTVLYSQNKESKLCVFKNNEISQYIDSIVNYEKVCPYFNDTTDCFIFYDILKYSTENNKVRKDTLIVISTIEKSSLEDSVQICYYRDLMFAFAFHTIKTNLIVNVDMLKLNNNKIDKDVFIIDDSRDIWVFYVINDRVKYSFNSGSCCCGKSD